MYPTEICIIENQEETFDIYHANKLWNDYWKDFYQNKYSNNNLVEENNYLKERLQKTSTDINKLLIAYKKMFEENIKLGEMIESLKTDKRELNFKVIDLETRYKEDIQSLKNDTALGMGYKVLQQAKKNKTLETKITELESRPNLLESVADKDPKIFDKIADLYLQGIKQKDIASKLNISTATVSRYLNKKEMQKRLQALHDNATSL